MQVKRKLQLCAPHNRPVQKICFSPGCTVGVAKGCQQCIRSFHQHNVTSKAGLCKMHKKPIDKFCFDPDCIYFQHQGCSDCMEQNHLHQQIDFCKQHNKLINRFCVAKCDYPMGTGCQDCMVKYHNHTKVVQLQSDLFFENFNQIILLSGSKQQIITEKQRFKELIRRYFSQLKYCTLSLLNTSYLSIAKIIQNYYFNQHSSDVSDMIQQIDLRDFTKIRTKDLVQLYKLIQAKAQYNFNLYQVKKNCQYTVVLDGHTKQLTKLADKFIASSLIKNFAFPIYDKKQSQIQLAKYLGGQMQKWKISSLSLMNSEELQKQQHIKTKDEKSQKSHLQQIAKSQSKIKSTQKKSNKPSKTDNAKSDLQSKKSSDATGFNQAYIKAQQLYKQGKFFQALLSYQQAKKIRPNEPKVYNSIGAVYYSQDKFKEAIQAFDKALSLNPKYPHALNNKGNVLCDINNFQEAIKVYNLSLQINEKDSSAMNGIGNSYIGLKNYKQAISWFDKAIAINPLYANYYNNKGNALFALKQFQEASQLFRKAHQLNPSQPLFKSNLENALGQLKK